MFSNSLGLLQDTTAKLYVNTEAAPKFFRARPVPYRLKNKIEVELRRLQDLGIITPVQHSEWTAPIVPIMKRDGLMHLCGDYKVTVTEFSLQIIIHYLESKIFLLHYKEESCFPY